MYRLSQHFLFLTFGTGYRPSQVGAAEAIAKLTGEEANPPVVSGQATNNPLVTNNPPAISIPPVPAVMTITNK
ncbi:hypothetical protein DPMN_108124 [Dreissena polymorpha]|uniref:Uncharacterized protein n=1 Tax=Dreissena polymorpha TaxID=45954 RepID=A0A9D4K889_DREPO|nr:hypothetical protein DPMN_108124 [Dreissena polymorpha]